jgi:hypothetical protein
MMLMFLFSVCMLVCILFYRLSLDMHQEQTYMEHLLLLKLIERCPELMMMMVCLQASVESEYGKQEATQTENEWSGVRGEESLMDSSKYTPVVG